jgi:hypothetical protein
MFHLKKRKVNCDMKIKTKNFKSMKNFLKNNDKKFTLELIAGAILHIASIANEKKFNDEDFTAIDIMVQITPEQFEAASLLLQLRPETVH